MIKNILKIVFRNIRLNPGYSVINILGLAVGMTSGILIFIFVNHEFSYDRYHVKAHRIYRTAQKALIGNTEINQTWTAPPMAKALYQEYPEVETVVRITGVGDQTVKYGDKTYVEKRIFTADSTLFDVFTFAFIHGSPEGSLNRPNTVVITESTAKKYFGDENPIYKVVKMSDDDSERDYQVTGVIKDIPEESHFHFDFVFSMITLTELYNTPSWSWNNIRTYMVIRDNTDYKELESKFPAFLDKYLFEGKYSERMLKRGGFWEMYLQPLTEIHLTSDISGEFEPNGKKTYVITFIIIAVFILLIAGFNFMNLSTARSSMRAKEIGVRKVVGAGRRALIFQFLGESVLISLTALIIGIALVELLLPAYADMLGRRMDIRYWDNVYVLPLLLLLAVTVGVLSGIYPALFLSSFKPVSIFKSRILAGASRSWLRNTLVIAQFSISIILIVSTIVVYRQLVFIQNERLGFDKEHVIVLKNPYILGQASNTFKESLRQYPGIQSVSASVRIPGKRFSNLGFHYGEQKRFTLNITPCDPEFVNVMGLEMIEGRFFSKDFPTDSSAIIINEAAKSLLELNEPIGKILSANTDSDRDHFHVIGVVKDFYYESKRQTIRPMALIYLHGNHTFGAWNEGYISVRANPGSMRETLSFIEDTWNKYSGGLPVDYSFLNDEYDILYKNEMQTRQLFVIFSILAIGIACLGLFGLASFMTERRTKEIGIRKTLGATVSGIAVLLSRKFIKWVLAANIIAWPVAYYMMNHWLESYAYRIDLSWWMFAVSGTVALFIALLTISYQTLKAARANPVESLRYE